MIEVVRRLASNSKTPSLSQRSCYFVSATRVAIENDSESVFITVKGDNNHELMRADRGEQTIRIDTHQPTVGVGSPVIVAVL